MKKIALITALTNFFISIQIWYNFDNSTTQMQYVTEFSQINFLNLNFGVDSLSHPF